MSEKKIKKLRKKLLTNTAEILMIIRNEYGELTEQMNARQIYQVAKRLYKQGKIKI
ncbi:MAG: hypothetical protein ACFFG0_01445 [Candidatus Thorarchaeota archaeon]